MVRDVSIHTTHPNLNIHEAINTCLHVVNSLIQQFETHTTSWKGYIMNCNENEKSRFVELLIRIVERSDYMRVLHELPEDEVTTLLNAKYGIVRDRIMSLV